MIDAMADLSYLVLNDLKYHFEFGFDFILRGNLVP